jgi:hypothetical protein
MGIRLTRGGLAFTLLVVAAPLHAQTITGYTCPIRGFGPVVISVLSVPLGSMVCNQPQPLVTNTVNPTKLALDDPAFPPSPDPASRACIFTDGPAGVLALLPISANAYTGSCVADSSAGSSASSLPSNTFTRVAIVPTAPTNLRIYR